VRLLVGDPLRARDGEDALALTARVQAEVARLLDEDTTDWWSSLRRAAEGDRPALKGPPASSWRRTWEASRPVQGDTATGPEVWRA
ncbi:MAG: phospholipid/glycerol acyltransferase, partial [Frankiales bacterium]|nr:phospholipid/glycerol acyltransferase [Frankiales bacterium]